MLGELERRIALHLEEHKWGVIIIESFEVRQESITLLREMAIPDIPSINMHFLGCSTPQIHALRSS